MRHVKRSKYSAVPVAVTVQEAFGDDDDILGGGGGGGSGRAAHNDQPLDPAVSLSDIQTKCIRVDKPCWGCIFNFGPSRRPGQNANLDALWKEFETNKDTMEPSMLYRHLYDAWFKLIYSPQIEQGKKMVHWSAEEIERHLKYHLFDMRLTVQTQLREFDIVLTEIKESLFRRDSSGVNYTDADHIKSYVMITQQKERYVKLGLEIDRK